ncbi:histidine phosphatase family protein [Aliikangiella sp. G2MR2-5]|uniref:histidine phosphatase family protein n=1 Tax=Aliikangiella sp. G2MR2-5 TaxID=2788943 RepID=UPI0018AC190A|nr:histidine phosphatase family protein [Aliikangiella sp. G2MR2-5]
MNTEIFLIRHGEPVLTGALLGSTDSPLSQNGWTQLETAFKNIEDIDLLVSSPLSRCAAFAQYYADENSQLLHIEEDWRECHFGDWDGQTYQSLHQKYPQEVARFFSVPAVQTPPQGESLLDFCHRVENALTSLLQSYQGKRIAILTHAGIIRTLVAWCLKMDYTQGTHLRRFAVDYASMTHISIYHGDNLFPQLLNLNQTFVQEIYPKSVPVVAELAD